MPPQLRPQPRPSTPTFDSPTWQKAEELSRKHLQEDVAMGREVAREAAGAKYNYGVATQGLQTASAGLGRTERYTQSDFANQARLTTNSKSAEQQAWDARSRARSDAWFDQSMANQQQRSAGGSKAVSSTGRTGSGSGGSSSGGKSSELALMREQANLAAKADRDKRDYETRENALSRAFQQQQSAADRQSQRDLADIDARSRTQSSAMSAMSQVVSSAKPYGYNFW